MCIVLKNDLGKYNEILLAMFNFLYIYYFKLSMFELVQSVSAT